jgi:Fic family protein
VRNIDYRLVTIHPFVEGNERAARRLMNLLLRMRGSPPQSFAPAIGLPISVLSNARNSAAQGLILTLLSQRPRSGH